MKVCSKCKRGDDEVIFNKKKASKDGLNSYCKGCNKEASAKHYISNRVERINSNAIRREKLKQENKLYITSVKTVCCKCGETEYCCLDFHHVDMSNKDYNIPIMVNSGYLLESLKKELSKCIVVCSNCHRKIHAGII